MSKFQCLGAENRSEIGTETVIEKAVIVEIDGEYHDYTYKDDTVRQQRLESAGWHVLRFSNEEILEDVDAVACAIGKRLGVEVDFLMLAECPDG